jgi:hypothetical protein
MKVNAFRCIQPVSAVDNILRLRLRCGRIVQRLAGRVLRFFFFFCLTRNKIYWLVRNGRRSSAANIVGMGVPKLHPNLFW